MRVLVLGGTGMIGHKLYCELRKNKEIDVYSIVRFPRDIECFPSDCHSKLLIGIDVNNFDSIIDLLVKIKPNIVINCVGITKRVSFSNDHLLSIQINSLLPHRLSALCILDNIRLIHMSTDCVFDGKKGNYTEQDTPNAEDLYGKTKGLGELCNANSLTIRTSMIGHEIKGKTELLEWFLSQKEKVKGFTGAWYSGITTLEMANILLNYIIPDPGLNGLYNISSTFISKYELLKIISKKYSKTIEIEPNAEFRIDRTLNSDLFKEKTGYHPPNWEELVDSMYNDFRTSEYYLKN